jgi:hypothetical protein
VIIIGAASLVGIIVACWVMEPRDAKPRLPTPEEVDAERQRWNDYVDHLHRTDPRSRKTHRKHQP